MTQATSFERSIINGLDRSLNILRALHVSALIAVLVTLDNIEGVVLGSPESMPSF